MHALVSITLYLTIIISFFRLTNFHVKILYIKESLSHLQMFASPCKYLYTMFVFRVTMVTSRPLLFQLISNRLLQWMRYFVCLQLQLFFFNCYWYDIFHLKTLKNVYFTYFKYEKKLHDVNGKNIKHCKTLWDNIQFVNLPLFSPILSESTSDDRSWNENIIFF